MQEIGNYLIVLKLILDEFGIELLPDSMDEVQAALYSLGNGKENILGFSFNCNKYSWRLEQDFIILIDLLAIEEGDPSKDKELQPYIIDRINEAKKDKNIF